MIHILIVEDDKELDQTVCRHLNAHNYQAAGVLRAEEAFNQLYADHFDLIILDITMPGMDGFEFAETMRRQDKEVQPVRTVSEMDAGKVFALALILLKSMTKRMSKRRVCA